jgi:hypothetical protein
MGRTILVSVAGTTQTFFERLNVVPTKVIYTIDFCVYASASDGHAMRQSPQMKEVTHEEPAH